MAKASRAAARAAARSLLGATADPDGRGLLLRGQEFHPAPLDQLDPAIASGVLRLARLADQVGTRLLEHPDAQVRRSAAVLTARAYPLLLGLGG